MSPPVAVPTTVNPARSAAPQRRPGLRIKWWIPLVALRQVTARLFTRAWRRLGGKARFRLKILVAILLLLAPLWTLNLAVAFFGRTAVFPLSPYFVREKIAALGAYARHWVRCRPRDHKDVDRLVKEAEIRHHLAARVAGGCNPRRVERIRPPHLICGRDGARTAHVRDQQAARGR